MESAAYGVRAPALNSDLNDPCSTRAARRRYLLPTPTRGGPARVARDAERFIPISQRLGALLEMRRHGPDGAMFGPDDYVFGNAIGARVGSVNTSWQATCGRAGIEDLNFHDLRREAGSRLLEGGMPEHYVQRFPRPRQPLHDVRGIWRRPAVGCTRFSGNMKSIRRRKL